LYSATSVTERPDEWTPSDAIRPRRKYSRLGHDSEATQPVENLPEFKAAEADDTQWFESRGKQVIAAVHSYPDG
jgi:hypothetical protein